MTYDGFAERFDFGLFFESSGLIISSNHPALVWKKYRLLQFLWCRYVHMTGGKEKPYENHTESMPSTW
jgi:hypothetical protein